MPSYVITIHRTSAWNVHVKADDRGEAKDIALARMINEDGPWGDEPDQVMDFEVMDVEEQGHD